MTQMSNKGLMCENGSHEDCPIGGCFDVEGVGLEGFGVERNDGRDGEDGDFVGKCEERDECDGSVGETKTGEGSEG